ncbi:MAG: N-acetyltransferase [Caulobacter sp.]|nr:N-acetyltransferase [Caulobacter sp.]
MTDITLRPETPDDHPAIDQMIARAFGPGRYAKASERLREGNTPLAGIGMVAATAEGPVGCARMWPVKIGEASVAFLGPLAVEAGARRAGLGAELVEAACRAAQAAGFTAVLLVGDLPFFERVGFDIAPGVKMPGPTDPRRILVRPLVPGGAEGLEGTARVP